MTVISSNTTGQVCVCVCVCMYMHACVREREGEKRAREARCLHVEKHCTVLYGGMLNKC